MNNLVGMSKYDLTHLTAAANTLEKMSGFFLSPNKPITGTNAFSHKSGVHTNGVLKDPRTYEPFDPSTIGRERKIVIDKYTGKAAVAARLAEYGVSVEGEMLEKIVEQIKHIGDERKFLHDADIVEVAERVTGQAIDIFPKEINAIMMVAVESHVYTGSVVRRLRSIPEITTVFEITGDYDITAYVKVQTTMDLNNLIEELRAIPGVKLTDTRVVLRKYSDNGF